MRRKVYLVQVGNCRGDNFSSKHEFSIKELEDVLENISSDYEWPEERKWDDFNYLFYNVTLSNKKHKEVLKKFKCLIKRLQDGKSFVETWEEGTTGIGTPLKELELKVLKAERSCSGEDISKFWKK